MVLSSCMKRLLGAGLAAVVVLTGFSVSADAVGNVPVLPSGGVSVTLEKGVTIQAVQDAAPVAPAAEIVDPVSSEDVAEVMETILKAAPEQPSEEELFKNLVIASCADFVNVRSLPSTDGEIVGKLYNNSVGTLVQVTDDGWYQITSGTTTGYVKGSYCVTGDEAVALARQVGKRYAVIDTTTLYVREEPTTESDIIYMVPMGEEFILKGEQDGWAQIDTEVGDGWISTDYVKIRTEFTTAESREEERARLEAEAEARRKAQAAALAKKKKSSASQQQAQSDAASYIANNATGSDLGKQVAQYAIQFVGNPYVYGGTSLTKGADCSGFVLSVYKNFGVSLPHSATADRKQGYAVDGLSNAQPGDLLCFSGHVGIYIGDGKFVHASNRRTGIIISQANYREILAIRRIF